MNTPLLSRISKLEQSALGRTSQIPRIVFEGVDPVTKEVVSIFGLSGAPMFERTPNETEASFIERADRDWHQHLSPDQRPISAEHKLKVRFGCD